MKTRRLWTVLQAGFGLLILLSPLAFAPELAASRPPSAPPTGGEGGLTDWWTAVQEDLRHREYNVTWQESTLVPGGPAPSAGLRAGGYQAPNRAQNLRIGFYPIGVRIVPRVVGGTPTQPSPRQGEGKGGGWALSITLTGFGREGAMASVEATSPAVRENQVTYRHVSLIERYSNEEGGLEQEFQIPKPKAQSPKIQSPVSNLQSPTSNPQPPVALELALTGDLIPHLTDDPSTDSGQGGQAVQFTTADGAPVLRYGPPHATDASGRSLPARLEIRDQVFGKNLVSIVVDDSTATYPITLRLTIAALPFSADWTGESNQDHAGLGYALSTAGDVNGDGYSDLIVGAPWYDGGQTDEGAVFVYHGSSMGLTTGSADWTAHPTGQAYAHFGHAVSIAGDVNGDGYADVVIGAPDYDDVQADRGAAYVYHGGESGLTTGPADWTVTGNQENDHFGYSVSTAGDVNGDGHADVVIGAPDYDDIQANRGAAYVYHGGESGLTTDPADWTAEGGQAGDHFGTTVSTAGDVNGDGYSDVIVGAPDYDVAGPTALTDAGRAYVYHGGESGLTTDPADWTAEGGQADAHLGTAVSTAGDANGDGYADVVIGVPDYDATQPDEGAAFVYQGSSTGLTTGLADWTAHPTGQAYAHFGTAISIAGDVNSDSYADIIVGAPDYDATQPDEGAAFVYQGSSTGLTTGSADWTAHPTGHDHARFGCSVSIAGDVNGDGHSDLAVGASGYDHEHTDEGGAFVYHGSPDGLAAPPSWSTTSKQNGALLGWSVSTAGDVDGDGYADVIVGAPRYDHGQTEEGVAFLYTGGPGGSATSPAWMGESDQEWAWFGYAVATAGDVDGDGYSDIVVGAPRYDITSTTSLTDAGQAFVYHGSSTGLTTGPADWTAHPAGQADARLGTAVATAGDVNGDGYADVVITANGYDADQINEGAAFVYHGSSTGLTTGSADWTAHPTDQAYANFGRSASTAGDVNGDGYSDVVVGAPWYDDIGTEEGGAAFVYRGSATGLSGTPDGAAIGDQSRAEFGIAVSTAGDVNGDGYSDIIVGAFHYTGDEWHEGAAFVYHGSSTGLTMASADWTATGGYERTKFGLSVSTAGDVNGDGYADVVVGGPNYADGESHEGVARVYHGSSTGLTTGSADWSIHGNQEGAWYGFAVSTAGDVNGDGYSDIIIGAPTYNYGWTDEGRAFVYLGNGGGGLPVRPRQLRSDGSAPIAPLGRSDSASQVRLQVTARSPLGRDPAALQWQLAPLGIPFTASTAISGTSPFLRQAQDVAWSDVLTSGVVLSQTVDGLTGNTVYRWRVRLLYRPGNRLGQAGSRWLYLPWNGPQEADFRTPSLTVPGRSIHVFLPMILRSPVMP
jgi:hypothetical protein